MRIEKMAFLTSRKRAVIALRVVMTLAVTAISLSQLPKSPWPMITILGVYALTNLVLSFEKPQAFLRRFPEMLLFGFDLAVVTALMIMAGETRSQFYVIFFLIILMAGLSKSSRATVVLACISSAVYGLLVGAANPAELIELGFTTRVALFFVIALFAGYMAEEAHKERGEHRRFEGFYRGLFDQSGDGVLVAGTDDVIREANPRAIKILGSDPRGKMLWDVLRVSGEDVPAAGSGSSGRIPTMNSLSVFSLDLARADGETVSCEATLRHLHLEGETYRLLLLRDVGAIRDLQRQMAELEKGSVMGQLVASITHEINNPLAVILGYAELLEEGPLGAEEREYAGYIREAGQRCKRVVDSFLDQYRSRPFTPAPARLGEVVRDAARLMDFHLRYNLVKMEMDVKEDPEVLVDRGQIEQLLINLISNAVKSMQGRPRKLLRLRVKETERESLIEVSDTGCGIPRDHLARLFTRGFTARADGSGHGLGLALSQEIANRHGGTVAVESEAGQGTTFIVRLPKAGAALGPAPEGGAAAA